MRARRHPYAGLPARQIWRRAVGALDSAPGGDAGLAGLWQPAFALAPGARVAGLGSCFARHMTPWLRAAGLALPDHEPPPPFMEPQTARAFGYLAYPCRTGDIYTARQMRQLVEDAAAGRVDPGAVWWRAGRAHDALRPGVEPEGLDNAEEVLALRRAHLACVRRMLEAAECLVFTLGMTEGWACTATGRVVPLAPGIIAGEMDRTRFRPIVFGQAELREDLRALRRALRGLNPGMKLLLTVSPVPLAATAMPAHALGANAAAKAALRTAAGEFAARHGDVDYFPAWEIVMHPGRAASPFADDLRTVRPEVVAQVMRVFLAAQGLPLPDGIGADRAEGTGLSPPAPEDAFCIEQLTDAFGPGAGA